MGHSKGEGWQNAEEGSDGRSGSDGKLLAKAVTIDCRKERYCRFCSETNFWSDRSVEGVRHALRRCCKAITSKLRQTSGRSWSESSSSGEPQWVPARTPTVHWEGLNSRKAVDGPFGERQQIEGKHGSGAGC